MACLLQVFDGAAYHTHLDNMQRIRKGTLQVSTLPPLPRRNLCLCTSCLLPPNCETKSPLMDVLISEGHNPACQDPMAICMVDTPFWVYGQLSKVPLGLGTLP